ncbi:MAG: hypothetical protein HY901_02560, partial [Deltaproteobacteria bacterium]|nr:hypothetical protein [Deltaproteobacteria bacterium]
MWRHRNGVCSTWFCKHARGFTARRFWSALEQALTTAEEALARHCVLALDPGPEALRRLFSRRVLRPMAEPSELDGQVVESVYRAVWGRWAGREQELFRAAADLVASLRWEEVVRIGGSEVAAAA